MTTFEAICLVAAVLGLSFFTIWIYARSHPLHTEPPDDAYVPFPEDSGAKVFACPWCDGTGRYQIHSTATRRVWKDCQHCDGTGQIPAEPPDPAIRQSEPGAY